MQIEYRRNLNKSFMIIMSQQFYAGYELEMFENNKINGFLEFETVVADGKDQFWYDITGKQSLDAWLDTGNFRAEELFRFIGNLCEICDKMKAYLLKPESILLLPDTIFLRNEGDGLFLCFYPVQNQDIGVSFRELMEYLLQKINHKDEKLVHLGYEIYQWTLEDSYSLNEIVQKLGTEKKQPAFLELLEPADFETEKTGDSGCRTQDVYAKSDGDNSENSVSGAKKEKESFLIKCKKKILEETGLDKVKLPGKKSTETGKVIAVSEPETEPAKKTPTLNLLGKRQRIRGELRYQGGGDEEDIIIGKSPFLIGSSREQADGVVKTETVSRIHARITVEDSIYYIEDLNSTNGTFINGEEVNYRTPVALNIRDNVSFADEEYTFF